MVLTKNKGFFKIPCMLATSTLSKKNQTTLPKEVIKVLGVGPSQKLLYYIKDGKVTLGAKTGRLVDLACYPFPKSGRKKPLTIKQMDEAIGQGALDRYLRSSSRK